MCNPAIKGLLRTPSGGKPSSELAVLGRGSGGEVAAGDCDGNSRGIGGRGVMGEGNRGGEIEVLIGEIV